MAGRPRKPTAVLEDTGAFKHDPKRGLARANEPKPVGPVGEPPAYFDASHREVWDEYIAEAPRGVLTTADRKQLELAVRLTCRMRIAPGKMTKALNFLSKVLLSLGMPEEDVTDFKEAMRATVGCSAQELSLLHSCLQRMALTPSDRSKVTVEPEKKESRFAGIAAAIGSRPRPN